jgi:ABC-2 type transport system permease protein
VVGHLLGVSFPNAHLLPALMLFVLSVGAPAGIGILSATFELVFKMGDALMGLFGSISWLLGESSIKKMPRWMSRLAELLPITHALRGIRSALLDGATISQLFHELISCAHLLL